MPVTCLTERLILFCLFIWSDFKCSPCLLRWCSLALSFFLFVFFLRAVIHAPERVALALGTQHLFPVILSTFSPHAKKYFRVWFSDFLQKKTENFIIENSCVCLPTNYHQYSKTGGNLTFILPNNVLYIPTMLWMIARPAKKNKTFYQQFLF